MTGPGPHRDLGADEVELRGRFEEGGAPDEVERRIRWLVAHRLDAVACADGGWEWLFRDARDGRLWELTFPEGSLHGSGPRRLTVATREHAAARYDPGVCDADRTHRAHGVVVDGGYHSRMPAIATIGYEGTTVSAFLDALRTEGVQLLIDIRAVASSRRPGFAKTRLSANLAEAGIDYLHMRGLGTPSDGRAAARAGRHAEMRAIFERHLAKPETQFELESLAELVRLGRSICLLCFEADPAHCHRAIVASALHSLVPISVHHLHPLLEQS